jgi:hypothetical protein
MTKTLENFIKKIKKLDNYYILREESEYFIVGTQIIIKEHKEILGNVFQPFSKNVDRKVPIFFMIIIGESQPQHKIFIRNNLPVLEYHTNMKDVKVTLDNFIESWI